MFANKKERLLCIFCVSLIVIAVISIIGLVFNGGTFFFVTLVISSLGIGLLSEWCRRERNRVESEVNRMVKTKKDV